LQNTPGSFDVSVWELFWPLMTGAGLVLAEPEGHKDPAYLAQLICDEEITTVHFVPSMLQIFLAEEGVETMCASLRRVICSGEVLPYALQERFFERLPNVELHNLYGPTEAAVDVTAWACRRSSPPPAVPIGRAISNVQIYLLDRYLEPVPVGGIGELHIGGEQVARGYHNRPDLTSERFLPDLFGPRPERRLYKTGDLACFLPDGAIEYRGRTDSQVKIRGVRIEPGEIEAVLEQHPAVREAAVLTHADEAAPGAKRLVAYLIPTEEGGPAVPGTEPASPSALVAEWEEVFDRAYAAVPEPAAPDFNIAGWNSTYTGEPLTPEEMREWVDTTVERILALKPRRVLEIGCGTGLLLARIAPFCEVYRATDSAATALELVRTRLLERRPELAHARAQKCSAEDFSCLGDEPFDLVILNSVVQYFPDVRYLRAVVGQALARIGDRGAVFVGDVRNLTLLETFHAEVELQKASAPLPVERLRARVRQRLERERELVLHPDFFRALQREEPRIGHVEIQLRRGVLHNEMTRYRYDAVLHVGRRAAILDAPRLDWCRDGLTLEAVEQRLRSGQPAALCVHGVSNGRLAEIHGRLARLGTRGCETLGGLPRSGDLTAGHADGRAYVDPERWWELGERTGYAVSVDWMPGRTDGSYAVLLQRAGAAAASLLACPLAGPAFGRLADIATDPAFTQRGRALVAELRGYLKERVPDYMLPAAFVPMRRFPVNASGKLDRGALPPPVFDAADGDGAALAPDTPTERILAAAWAEVLGVESFGVASNFFALGGDSIRAIHVVARARKRGLDLTPQMIFKHGTLAELAAALDGPAGTPGVPSDGRGTVDSGFAARLDALRAAPGVEDVYPLAPFQAWALRQWLESPAPGLFQIHRLSAVPLALGTRDDLRKALTLQAEAYPALRTSFAWEGLPEPLQVVHRSPGVDLQFEDWRGLSSQEQDAALERYLAADRERGIAPVAPGGMRYFVADLDADTCLMVVSISYLCVDGWSYDILADQLMDSLAALGRGEEVGRRACLPYREFVEHVRRQDPQPAERYWRRALRGLREPLHLSRHLPGNAVGSERGFARQWISLPEDLAQGLREVARQSRLTLNVLFQAGWAATAAAFVQPATAPAGQIDVVHGALLTGRSSGPDGVVGMVGPALNILPLRMQLARDERVSAFLSRVMAELVDIGTYENTALDQVLAWSELPTGQLPGQSYLVFQNVGVENSERFAPAYYVSRMGFPLRLDVFPTKAVTLHMSYYREIFTDAAITRLISAYCAVLRAMVMDQRQLVSDLLAAAQRDHPAPADLRTFHEGAFHVEDIRALASDLFDLRVSR
jgi:non-ribosomal peptide synthetase component F/SAM-dependent methyltransferase/aryl carrier-like protein